MVNETATAIDYTRAQYDGIMLLSDKFRQTVTSLILQTEGIVFEPEDFPTQLISTPNHIIVNYRIDYHKITYLLHALVRRDGSIFSLKGTPIEYLYDYIFIVD